MPYSLQYFCKILSFLYMFSLLVDNITVSSININICNHPIHLSGGQLSFTVLIKTSTKNYKLQTRGGRALPYSLRNYQHSRPKDTRWCGTWPPLPPASPPGNLTLSLPSTIFVWGQYHRLWKNLQKTRII